MSSSLPPYLYLSAIPTTFLSLTSIQIICGHNTATYVFISPSSFFPSITFFLAMLTVILLISSQGIQAMKEVKDQTLEKELKRRDWQRPLSFLIWR